MAGKDVPQSGYARRVPAGLVVLGVAIILAQVGTQLTFNGVGTLRLPSTYLSFGTTGAFALVVAYGGHWLGRSSIATDRYPRVAAWCVALMAGFLAINLLMIAAWPADTLADNASWALFAASVGAAGGTLFGSIEARSIERARTAERASMNADHLEAQREWLEYLNGLLRHEVLNTANVIVGYAELVLEDFEGDQAVRERLERIDAQSRNLTDVIQDVRLLIEASNNEVALESVDLVEVLRGELSALEDRHEDVTIEDDLPDDLHVAADDLLARVFSNLLSNAVNHNDADDPHVEVTVTADVDDVTVTIADDGPGIPEHKRESLFEHTNDGGDHGLGLYLVRTLVARYDGSVELVETGPGGTTFAVVLPRASPEPLPVASPNAATVDCT